MPKDFHLFCLVILITAVALICTVRISEYWLIKKVKRPPRHYRAAPAKEKLVDPVAVRKCTVRPEDKTA